MTTSGNGNGKMDERTERKINLAQERNSRVVFANTVDTHTILNITSALDRGMRKLRANAFTQYPVQEVTSIFEEYQTALTALHNVTKRVCDYTKLTYRPPAGMGVPANTTELNLPVA
jgi:hypothetical protein